MELFCFRPRLGLAGLACAAFVLIVARAATQSITIDEADSYLIWATSGDPFHWQAASNNHILNSVLMRISTALLGTSHLSTRLPALIGSAIYLGAVVWCLSTMIEGALFQAVLFVCLVLNPFVLDFLVAARGYSLALGFLMSGVCVTARMVTRTGGVEETARRLAWVSLCTALAFAANFSFALVCGSLLAAATVVAFQSLRVFESRRVLYRALGQAAIMPGGCVTLLLCSWALLHWPRSELTYGSRSLREVVESVVTPSLHELNRHVVNPVLLPALQRIQPALIPAAVLTVVMLAIGVWRARRVFREKDRMLVMISCITFVVAAGSLALHWGLFRVTGILLPQARTAIYFVPLLGLTAGLLAGVSVDGRLIRMARPAVVVTLSVLAIHHVGCLRTSYFYEWQYDAGIERAYGVAREYAYRYEMKEVASRWMYVSGLRYYRVLHGERGFEVVDANEPGIKARIYVVHALFEEDLVRERGLRVVYRDPLSDVGVGVGEELLPLATCR